MADSTTIQIDVETWQALSARKQPGDSFDDVIQRLLTDERNDGNRESENKPDLRDQLAESLPGSGDVLDARVDAVLAMYAVLRDRDEATKSDLLDAVDVDETGYASAESVWSNMIKGRDTLRALPGVETPAPGRSTWHYSDN